MEFEDGSVASVAYCSQGDPSLPKERIEAMAGGRHAVIDDFRQVVLSSGGRSTKHTYRPQDKGQKAMLAAEAEAMRTGGPSPISIETLRATTLATLAAIESLRTGPPRRPRNARCGRRGRCERDVTACERASSGLTGSGAVDSILPLCSVGSS